MKLHFLAALKRLVDIQNFTFLATCIDYKGRLKSENTPRERPPSLNPLTMKMPSKLKGVSI